MGLIASINTENSNLNIRMGEGTDSPIIGSAAKGSQIEVLSTDNNGWTKVRVNDTVGYASSQYLKIEEIDLEPEVIPEETPAVPASNTGNGKMVEVNTERSSLNVRASADGNASVITQVGKGSQLEVLEEDNGSGWTKVRFGGDTEGFVSSKYIKPIDDNSQPLETPTVDINPQSSVENLQPVNNEESNQEVFNKIDNHERLTTEEIKDAVDGKIAELKSNPDWSADALSQPHREYYDDGSYSDTYYKLDASGSYRRNYYGDGHYVDTYSENSNVNSVSYDANGNVKSATINGDNYVLLYNADNNQSQVNYTGVGVGYRADGQTAFFDENGQGTGGLYADGTPWK